MRKNERRWKYTDFLMFYSQGEKKTAKSRNKDYLNIQK